MRTDVERLIERSARLAERSHRLSRACQDAVGTLEYAQLLCAQVLAGVTDAPGRMGRLFDNSENSEILE